MTDNTLGDELGQLPPDLTLGATSEQIMRRGRRIKTIRQSSIAGAAALAVFGITSVAVFAGHHGTQVVQSGSGDGLGLGIPASASPVPARSTPLATQASPVPVASAAVSSTAAASSGAPVAVSTSALASTAPPTASCSPAPQAADGAPAATNDGNPSPWGTLVQAGTDVGTGKSLVLYGFHIDDSAIPCTHFGMMLGTSDAAGTNGVTGMYAANEFDGSDLEPGFHAVSLSGGGNQVDGSYYIGYYVGAAASISVVANGVPVAAHVASWSVNPDVKFWWAGGGAGAAPNYGALSATDADGNVLPVGNHAQPGVG